MPYIPQERRSKHLNYHIRTLAISCQTPGEINYVITRLLHDILEIKGTSYAKLNELVGVLECAKLELYRRKVAMYEDQKIFENGDI